MSKTEVSSSSASLTRSLSKVKYKLSSTLKNLNSHEDHDTDFESEHILKAMKYDDIASQESQFNSNNQSPTAATSNGTPTSNNHSQQYSTNNRMPKSLSLSSIKAIGNNSIVGGNASILTNHDISESNQSLNQRGSNTSSEISSQLFESHSTSRKSSLESSTLNQIEESLLPLPPLTTDLDQSRSVTPNTEKSELRSPFHVPASSFANPNEQKSNDELSTILFSPPLSPQKKKRHESVCCDPLINLDQPSDVKVETNLIDHEPRVNDFADAMAQSILDKVDDESQNTEWKI